MLMVSPAAVPAAVRSLDALQESPARLNGPSNLLAAMARHLLLVQECLTGEGDEDPCRLERSYTVCNLPYATLCFMLCYRTWRAVMQALVHST